MSKDYYNDSYGEKPLSSGPFELVEWKKGQDMIVKPNKNYHGDKIPLGKSPSYSSKTMTKP